MEGECAGDVERETAAEGPFKTCGTCGRVFATRADWDALDLCGRSEDDGELPPLVLEFRNCSCGSTLAIDVTAEVLH